MESLGEIIRRTMGRGGTLVIPAFSVGRTQEMLYMIEKLREREAIPDVPVYLDSPMSQRATSVYKNFEEELKQEVRRDGWQSVGKNFKFSTVASADDSMLLCMETSPKIVISASGMLNGGRILHHLKTKLPDAKSTVLFVGYQVPGTKGYLLKNNIGKIRIHHQLVDVEAEIATIDTLSAHADSNELVKWVQSLKKKPRRVFLNHGEVPALEALQYRLKTELGITVVIPKEGEEFVL
jgi:metallo-beta-lactamase family protein